MIGPGEPASVVLLRAQPVLQGIGAAALQDLAARCEIRQLRSGEVLFSEGETGTEVFLVLAGDLRLSCWDPEGVSIVVGMVRAGEILGEMALLDPAPRSATAVSLGHCTVLAIPGLVFLGLIDEGHPAAAGILRELRIKVVRRLRGVDDRIDAVFGISDEGGRRPPRGGLRDLWAAVVGAES